MTVRDVHKNERALTAYTYHTPARSQRTGEEGDYDAELGKSPMAVWLMKAFDYTDAVSKEELAGMVVQVPIQHNAIVDRCMVRIDEDFDGTGSDDVNIGDSNDTDGWGDGFDFGTPETLLFDSNAAYNTGDAVYGTSGPQYYIEGDVIHVIVATADDMTQGQGILMLRVVTYAEDTGAEW